MAGHVSPELHQRRAATTQFAVDELNHDVGGRDAAGAFPASEWAKCATFGIQGLAVPQAHGGSDADPVTIALVLEALGYGCRDNGLLFSLGAQMWSCSLPLVRFGSATQQQRYLPGLCDGSLIGVLAMTEPGSGSDAFALTTTAVRTAGGWVLDGAKAFITNAPIADVFVVFAATEPGKAFAGVSAFLVERDTPGVWVGPPLAKVGLHTSPNAEVVLTGCHVPDDALLGSVGAGFAIFSTSMDWERSFILVPALGTMQRQLEWCSARARDQGADREVAQRVAEMHMRLEIGRLLVHTMARHKSGGKSPTGESSMVKLHLSESLLASSLDAVALCGDGLTSGPDFERDVRDALAARIYSGTSEIQRDLIARRLGL